MQVKLPTFIRTAHASRARSLGTGLALLAVLLAPLGCGDGDDSPTGPGTVTLVSGTPVSVSGAEDSERLYQITVPNGATRIVFQVRGGTGDVDMYVRAGQPPTPQEVTCASSRLTNEEDCELFNPQPGAWYVLLYGYEAYAGATLTATVTESSAAAAQ